MSDQGSPGSSRDSTPETTITMPKSSVSPPPAEASIVRAPLGLPPLADRMSLEGLREAERSRHYRSTSLNLSFTPRDDGLCFQNMTDALATLSIAQWTPNKTDTSIPQTEEEYRKVVKQLVASFKDMSSAKDTANSAYRKRLMPTEAVYYTDWAIEACAWNIVRMVKIIHTEGFKAQIYDRTTLDNICQTQRWTFQERIDWICKVLETSKNVAATLMKHEKVLTTIGAPHHLYKSTIVNTVSNGNRNVWVKAGREADADHQNRPNAKRRKVAGTDTNDDTTVSGKSNEKGPNEPKSAVTPPAATTSPSFSASPPPINFLSATSSHPLHDTTPDSTTTANVDEREDSVTKDDGAIKQKMVNTKGRSAIKQKTVSSKDEEAAEQKRMADIKATYKVKKVINSTKSSAKANKTATNTTANVNPNAPRTDTELEVARTLAGLSGAAHAKR